VRSPFHDEKENMKMKKTLGVGREGKATADIGVIYSGLQRGDGDGDGDGDTDCFSG
jgi:hypothetical protein